MKIQYLTEDIFNPTDGLDVDDVQTTINAAKEDEIYTIKQKFQSNLGKFYTKWWIDANGGLISKYSHIGTIVMLSFLPTNKFVFGDPNLLRMEFDDDPGQFAAYTTVFCSPIDVEDGGISINLKSVSNITDENAKKTFVFDVVFNLFSNTFDTTGTLKSKYDESRARNIDITYYDCRLLELLYNVATYLSYTNEFFYRFNNIIIAKLTKEKIISPGKTSFDIIYNIYVGDINLITLHSDKIRYDIQSDWQWALNAIMKYIPQHMRYLTDLDLL